LSFANVAAALPTREHVLLWIEENQLGRRNLTDDQHAAIGDSIIERRTALAKIERAKAAGQTGGRHHPKVSFPATTAGELHDRSRESRRAVAE
jgi:hypothetical protein